MTMTLPTTTTDRLRAVADIIEAHPERHDQRNWSTVQGATPRTLQGRVGLVEDETQCGTTCCAAGWAVVLTPADVSLEDGWRAAGADALGLNLVLADAVFTSPRLSADHRRPHLVALLRWLAMFPPEARTMYRWDVVDGDFGLFDMKRPVVYKRAWGPTLNHRTPVIVDGYVLGEHFVAYKDGTRWGPNGNGRAWKVDHLPSGRKVCYVRSLRDARTLVTDVAADDSVDWSSPNLQSDLTPDQRRRLRDVSDAAAVVT